MNLAEKMSPTIFLRMSCCLNAADWQGVSAGWADPQAVLSCEARAYEKISIQNGTRGRCGSNGMNGLLRLAFWAGLSIIGSVDATAQQYLTMGAGTKSCAVFARTYKQKPKSADMIYFSWAQGYMSGINRAAASNNKDVHPANLNARSIAAQQRFIREFCDRNPLRDYREAVDALLADIRNTKSGQ